MKKSEILLCSCLLGLMTPGCTGMASSHEEVSMGVVPGLWIMDEGDSDYIDRAAFRIRTADGGLVLVMGSMVEGEFIPEEDPVQMEGKGAGYILVIDGDSLEIEADETGLLFRHIVGDSFITYHFRNAAE